VVGELRKRGRPQDGRAADALQWTIDRETERAATEEAALVAALPAIWRPTS
jgi:hypothetical protein